MSNAGLLEAAKQEITDRRSFNFTAGHDVSCRCSLVGVAVVAAITSRSLEPGGCPSPPSALLVDPFADVTRTVSEFDAIRFTDGEKVHGTAIDQVDLLEIDGERSAFLIDRGTKDVHVVPCNPAADAQDGETVFNQQSVDSARHGAGPSGLLAPEKVREACGHP